GEKFASDCIVWTAGVMANPVVRATDLPLDDRGRITAHPSLRVINGDKVVEGAWTAGDVSAVPDLSGGGVGGFCVPNAQHAVRQGRLLAKNVTSVIRGGVAKDYFHKNMGAVAGLGIGVGVYQWKKLAVKGFFAWIMHRGYHGLAIPMWERKLRVFTGWAWNWIVKRDIVSTMAVKSPRVAFETYASRPAAAAPAKAAKPTAAKKAPAAKKAAPKAAAKPAAKALPKKATPKK
ncbi:MAG: NAD(P)/FAD-dependent oxidoreductase, partial [Micrococcales bacterium]